MKLSPDDIEEILNLLEKRCGIVMKVIGHKTITNIHYYTYDISLVKKDMYYNPLCLINKTLIPMYFHKEISGVKIEEKISIDDGIMKILSNEDAMKMAFDLPAISSVAYLKMFLDISGK